MATSSGTATRSARATALGPRATTAVAMTPSPTAHAPRAHAEDDPPNAMAHADEAMTLFRAIQAKFEP